MGHLTGLLAHAEVTIIPAVNQVPGRLLPVFRLYLIHLMLGTVLRIRIRIRRIRMLLSLLDPDPDPLVRGMDPDPDPSIIKQKYCFVTSF